MTEDISITSPHVWTQVIPTPTERLGLIIDPADLIGSGSVSSGTLRPDHLADTLLGEIDRLGLSSAVPAELAAAAQQLATSAADTVAPGLPESADEMVTDLIDFLNDAAPNGWTLQALEGDGADLCWQPVSLTAQLQAVGSRWIRTDYEAPNNSAVFDLIDRYDEDPEALQNFETSDWVNLDECYTRDLLNRWETQRADIWALFEAYCDAIGATSTLQALEGETIEDPEDMAAAIVNRAMTWAALELLRDINPDRY